MISDRINWIDHARGLCIILVVILHSTLGVEKAIGEVGWMNDVVMFAAPFRLPTFFLISGLLIGPTLQKSWSAFLDKRVFTLLYLYVIWLTIQFGFKAPNMIGEHGVGATVTNYFTAFVQPYGTLWFIYVLPIFAVITRLSMKLPTTLVLAFAFLAAIAPINTGWLLVDASATYFLYFYLGHITFRHWNWFADQVVTYPLYAMLGLGIWGLSHGLLLAYSALPILQLGFALFGAAALAAVAALLRFVHGVEILRWIGQNTIVVYLGFFLPMAISRTVLIKLGIFDDVGTIAALTTISAIIGSVLMYWVADRIGLAAYIYRKPKFQKDHKAILQQSATD